MQTKRFFLALILTFTCAAVASGQLLEDYRFKGKVVDSKGKGLGGVRITFQRADTGERFVFSTKEDGSFDRRKIDHGVYDVTFEKPGYVTRKEHFDWRTYERGTIVKDVPDILLESEAEAARRDLGKKEGKLYKEAYDALSASKWDTAYKKASELVELGAGPFEYAARFVLARSSMELGKADQAVKEYKRVLELKPDLFEAHFDLANLLAQKGDSEAAINEYQEASRLHPDDAETYYSIGAILFNGKRFDEAVPYLKKAVEADPSHGQAYRALGYAYLQAKTKDLPAGVASLEKYLELSPNAEDAPRVKQLIAELKKTPGVGR